MTFMELHRNLSSSTETTLKKASYRDKKADAIEEFESIEPVNQIFS